MEKDWAGGLWCVGVLLDFRTSFPFDERHVVPFLVYASDSGFAQAGLKLGH
jgi:hypothetical protein